METQEEKSHRLLREALERLRKVMNNATKRPAQESKWTGGSSKYRTVGEIFRESKLKREGLCRIHRGIFPCTTIPNNEVIYETTVKP